MAASLQYQRPSQRPWIQTTSTRNPHPFARKASQELTTKTDQLLGAEQNKRNIPIFTKYDPREDVPIKLDDFLDWHDIPMGAAVDYIAFREVTYPRLPGSFEIDIEASDEAEESALNELLVALRSVHHRSDCQWVRGCKLASEQYELVAVNRHVWAMTISYTQDVNDARPVAVNLMDYGGQIETSPVADFGGHIRRLSTGEVLLDYIVIERELLQRC